MGKTEFLPENRQTEYTRVLQELYIEDEQHLTEFPIKFITKLTNVENATKEALLSEEVGLIRDNGKVYYPNEVFLVDSVESARLKVEQAIKRVQLGQSIGVNGIDDPELVKMQEMTRQLELKSEMQKQTMQMQMEKLQILERNGASKETIIKFLLAMNN